MERLPTAWLTAPLWLLEAVFAAPSWLAGCHDPAGAKVGKSRSINLFVGPDAWQTAKTLAPTSFFGLETR